MGFPEQDVLFLGAYPLPGKATILSAPRKNKWDVRTGWGIAGGSTIWIGVEPSEIKVRLDFWLPEQYEFWKLIARSIFTPSVMTGQVALDVSHPVLNDPPIGITAVQVREVEAAKQDEEGGWYVEITLLEFKRPKPAIGQPKASIPNAITQVPTAQDALDTTIQERAATVAKLAGP